jgi:uncharacterized protein GlcG (DUF336 family)
MNVLNLRQADELVDRVFCEAARLGMAPLAAAVTDAGGHLLVAKRQDGASYFRIEIAHAKAWGALGMGYDTREITRRSENFPAFINAISTLSGGRIISSPGGLLIRGEGSAPIGALGISGDTGDNDEAVGLAALALSSC